MFSLDLRKHLQSASVYSTDLFDSIVDLDARQDFDGTGSTDTNAEVLFKLLKMVVIIQVSKNLLMEHSKEELLNLNVF